MAKNIAISKEKVADFGPKFMWGEADNQTKDEKFSLFSARDIKCER